MKKVFFTVMTFFFIALCLSAYAQQNTQAPPAAIFKIRSIIPSDAHSARSLGTIREGNGVLIDEDGQILTIGYLILEAEAIEIMGLEGKKWSAKFVGYDYNSGFGLLRADKPLGVPPLKLGQSLAVKKGDSVLIAGYGGSDAVQEAMVIARREFAGYWEYLLDDAIFTIPPYPNFGGAVMIGNEGQILGIGSLFTTMTIPEIGTIPCNMFVPIDHLKPILNDLIATGRSKEPSKPWLGLNAEEVRGRVFVLRVTSGGPAEKAGIQPGDIILTVNKRTVTGLADFYRKVWALGSAGVDVPLSILKGTQILEVTVSSSDRYHFLRLKPKERWAQSTF